MTYGCGCSGDGTGVHVYIVDTGIRGTHVEFSGRLGNGFDYYGEDPYEDCTSYYNLVAPYCSYRVCEGAIAPLRRSRHLPVVKRGRVNSCPFHAGLVYLFLAIIYDPVRKIVLDAFADGT